MGLDQDTEVAEAGQAKAKVNPQVDGRHYAGQSNVARQPGHEKEQVLKKEGAFHPTSLHPLNESTAGRSETGPYVM